VSRVAKSGVSVRALREFGLALRSGPFRVAFVLSLIVHLVLLIVFSWGRLGGESVGERRIPLMRVRLIPPAAEVDVPASSPTEPAIKPPAAPKVKPPRPEPPGQQAAAVVPPLPAPVEPAPEAAVVSDGRVSGPAPAEIVRDAAPERRESGETAHRPVAAAPPPVLASAAVLPSSTPGGGVPAAGPASALSLPAAAEGGSSGADTNAAPAGEGQQAAGTAAVAPESHPGLGPRDLASVRHRIDAHKVYPQIAVRNGWEGRVLVEMRLEGDGSLTAVRLLEGSGYAVLDDATIVAVRRASPFPPVARVLTVPVEYRLVP
jgi:protein TonB